MSGYLLDSDFCIEFLRGNPIAEARLREHATEPMWIAMITVGELLIGDYKIPHPVGQERRLDRTRAFCRQANLAVFGWQEADQYARIAVQLAKGLTIGDNDLQIAAIALCNDLTLVTHNTGHFRRISDLVIEDWMA